MELKSSVQNPNALGFWYATVEKSENYSVKSWLVKYFKFNFCFSLSKDEQGGGVIPALGAYLILDT